MQNNIAILSINNPPVNAFGHAVRKGIINGINRAVDDDRVIAIILMSTGKIFSAGAEIKEFGKPSVEPLLSAVLKKIDASKKPVIAAIHGAALGAGLELALTCHFRIADTSAKFGLPEVKIGLLPGAGGTQLLPRVIGPEKALELITSGRSINSTEALDSGLIDNIIDGDLADGAIAFTKNVIKKALPLRRLSEFDEKIAATRGDNTLFDNYRKSIARKARGFDAPIACIEAIEASVNMPFAEGLKFEREQFKKLMAGSQSTAQRYAFFARRQSGKISSPPIAVSPMNIRKAAVIGAGTMGGGIAMNFVNSGMPVTLIDVNHESLERGINVIRDNYEITASKGKISQKDVIRRMSLITGTLDIQNAAKADIVIEAVFENMALKKKIFSKLDAICKKNAIIATNTSYLDVNEIASVTNRAENILGLHFFSPANVMRLIEVVQAEKTSPLVLSASLALAKKLNKIAVVVGVCHGFAGNRMYAQRKRESMQLVLEGAMPMQIDKVLFDFGFPIGPFALFDLVGLDLGWDRKSSTGSTINERLCEMGRFGLKSGSGYYTYKPGSRIPVPDPEVEKLIIEFSARKNIKRRKISDREILQRCIYPIINEGAKILTEGIAARPGDLDVIWVNGYGWPAYRGGPMFHADMIGLDNILDNMKKFNQKLGDHWKPAPLIEELANSGKGFKDFAVKEKPAKPMKIVRKSLKTNQEWVQYKTVTIN